MRCERPSFRGCGTRRHESSLGHVHLAALERAIAMAGCLESHALRVFGSGAIAENDAVHTLLKKLCDGTTGLPAEFKARDVRQKNWSGLARP